jgi:hypothetical protein
VPIETLLIKYLCCGAEIVTSAPRYMLETRL